MWLSLVERTVRDGEVVGSNPVIPTMQDYRSNLRFFFTLEELMISLQPINESNFLQAFALEVTENQKQFVSNPIRSLAQAYVYRNQCQPFGIYNDKTMVGYVMVIYDYDIPEYDIWHMQMDRNYQNRGYGKQALQCVLDYISSKPFGSSDKVTLTCHKDNHTAYHLYASMGFVPTGNMDEDEIEMSMTV